MNKVLIIGPLGQDGNLLCSILPNTEYDVWGICKPNTSESRIQNFQNKYSVKLVKSDFTEYENVFKVVSDVNPNIIINFAGLTNVFNPWEDTDNIFNLNCKLPLNFVGKFIENFIIFVTLKVNLNLIK